MNGAKYTALRMAEPRIREVNREASTRPMAVEKTTMETVKITVFVMALRNVASCARRMKFFTPTGFSVLATRLMSKKLKTRVWMDG